MPTKKKQGGGLDVNNLQPGSTPSNTAIDLTGSLDRASILQQQLSSFSANRRPQVSSGAGIGAIYKDPFVTAGIADPNIIHPADNLQAYQTYWGGDWASQINDTRNRIKEFRIMSLQDRTAGYQNMIDLMNRSIRDVDRMLENGDITDSEAAQIRKDIKAGAYNNLLKQSYAGRSDAEGNIQQESTFTEYMNQMLFNNRDITEWLNQDVMGKFVENLAAQNEEDLKEGSKDQGSVVEDVFGPDPVTYDEHKDRIAVLANEVLNKQRQINQEEPDFLGMAPVNPIWKINAQKSHLDGETFMSSIPLASKIMGLSDDLGGDNYFRYQMGEDLAGTLSTFEGHLGGALGAGIIHYGAKRLGLPKWAAGRISTAVGKMIAIGAGLAYSREQEGSMEIGEAYWRRVDTEIAEQEFAKGRPLSEQEKEDIRINAFDGLRDMRIKNRMLVGNDMAQFALTWFGLRGFTKSFLGRKFAESGTYGRLMSTYPGRMGINAARYGTFVNANRQMEGWEEGQQWKWTNDYLSGYSTDHNVWNLAGDFLNDGVEVAKAMAPNSMHELVGANPDIYTNHAFQEAVQSGRDMGTMMTAGPRAVRGIVDMYRFRSAVNSLGREGEAYDAEQSTKVKAAHIFKHMEEGTVQYLLSALLRAGNNGLFSDNLKESKEHALKAIQEISDAAQWYNDKTGKERFAAGPFSADMQKQLDTKGTKGLWKSLSGVKPLNKLERLKLFTDAMQVARLKASLEELNNERDSWLDNQEESSTSWLESDFMSKEEKDNVRKTLGEKGLGETPHDHKIEEIKDEIRELQRNNLELIADKSSLVPTAAGMAVVNKKRWNAYKKTKVTEKGEEELIGGLLFEIQALEKQQKEGALTPEAAAELKRMKKEALKERYEMLTEPLLRNIYKKNHRLAKSLALYNASVISQKLVENPKANLGEILREMLDRNIKVDEMTLSEIDKMQRFYHHHAKKIEEALRQAKYDRAMMPAQSGFTAEQKERRKTLRKFQEEGSITGEQLKELAKLDGLSKTSEEITEAQDRIDILNAEYEGTVQTRAAIDKFRSRKKKSGRDQFMMKDSEFAPISDAEFNEKIAKNQIFNDLEYIKNNIDNNADYSDQEGVEAAIQNLKSLKDVFELRNRDDHPWITDELLQMMDINIDKLDEFLTVVTDRVNDRTREQYLYELDVFTSLLDAMGLDFETLEARTEFGKLLEEVIGSDNLLSWREDVKTGKIKDKHAAALLLLQMFKSSTEAAIVDNKELTGLKKAIANSDAINRLLKATGVTNKGFKAQRDAYMLAPRNQFSFLLAQLVDTNADGTGIDDKGAYLDYTIHKNLHRFLRDIKEAGARPEDKTLTQQELIDLVEAQIDLEAKLSVYEYMTSDFRIDEQITNEWTAKQNPPQETYPSKQQLIAIRDLVRFLKRESKVTDKNLYSNWVYLKSPAGTGKTKVILPWMLATSGIPLNRVLAVGHNQHSSKTVNEAIGKTESEILTLPALLEMLNTNAVSSDIELILVDEVAGLDGQQLQTLADSIQAINIKRQEDNIKPLKVVATGDPNQMTADYTAEFSPIDNTTIEIVTPVSTVYRTDIAPITNFQDLFRGNPENLSGTELDVKMNAANPYGVKKTDELMGVWGTNSSGNELRENIMRRLKETSAEDNRSRAIITTPELIDTYKKLLEGHAIDFVEVLEVTEAQGRTIEEVYIDIPNKQSLFKSSRAYNKAIYTAASRAQRFVMVGNLSIKNHSDVNLTLASGRTSEQLIERAREFDAEVDLNLDWVKKHNRELDFSQPGDLTEEESNFINKETEESEKISEGKGQDNKEAPVESAKESNQEKEVDTSIEVEEDQETLEPFSNTIDNQQEWDETSQSEEQEEFEGEGVLLEDNIDILYNAPAYTVRFPEYASVKGYYKLIDGVPVWQGESVEGKEINNILGHTKDRRGSQIFIVKGRVQKKGADGKMKDVDGLVLISRATDLDGNEVYYKNTRGLYHRVAVLQESELDNIPFLSSMEKAELKRKLIDKSEPVVRFDPIKRGLIASPEGVTPTRISEVALINDLYVRQRQKLNYEYAGYEQQDELLYSRVRAEEWDVQNKNVVENLISQFISEFYSEYQKPGNKSHLLQSKVRVYTDSDIKNNVDDINSAPYKIKPGIPYLVLQGTETEGTSKYQRQFIQMRPRKMSSAIIEDYEMYLEPIEQFIVNIETIENATGLVYGTEEFREFMKSQYYPEEGQSDPNSKYQGKDWAAVKQQIWAGMPKPIDPNSPNGVRIQNIRTETNNLVETQIEIDGEVVKQTGKAQHAIHLLAKANKDIAVYQTIDGKRIRMGKGLFSMAGQTRWTLSTLKQWFVNQDSQGYLQSGLRVPINLKTFRYGETSKAFNGIDELSTNRLEADLNLENILIKVHPTTIVIDRGEVRKVKKDSRAEREGERQKQRRVNSPRRKNIKGSGRSRDFKDESQNFDLKGNKVSSNKARKLLAELLPDLFDKSGRAKFISFDEGASVTTGFQILSALDMIRKGGDANTLGRFMNNVIYLVNDGAGVYDNVIRHEVLHKVFAHYLTKGERAALLQAARERYAKQFAENGDVYLNKDAYTDEMIEEKLANEFMTLEKDTSLKQKIRKIIKKVLKFFGIVNTNATNIDKFFRNIDNGYFAGFEGDVIATTRNFQDIIKDFGSINVYRHAKRKFIYAYTDLLYNLNNEEQKYEDGVFYNSQLTSEEALAEAKEHFQNEFDTFLREGETVEDLDNYDLNLYRAYEALSKTSILRSLHNELYRKKVKTIFEESSERFEDTEAELSNVDLRDHILSAKQKDSVNSLTDHTLDFLNTISYKVGDEVKLLSVRNGYFRLLGIFHGMSMDMTQEELVDHVEKRHQKMGGNSNLAGVALKNGVIDLINRAHMTEYNLNPLPVNVQFYNEDLFLISKDKDFNVSQNYNPKVQVNEDVIAIKRKKEGAIKESTEMFWGRIMEALDNNNIEVDPNALGVIYRKEIASKALRNIYNNTSNKREGKLKVGQYERDRETGGYRFKWFARKTFGNKGSIEAKLEDFISKSYKNLSKKSVANKLYKTMQKDPVEGIKGFFNTINFPFDNHVIATEKGTQIAAAIKYFLDDINTVGNKIQIKESIENEEGIREEQTITRDKTIEDVMRDHSTLFELLSTSLNATDSRAKSQSIRNVEGNIIYKFHDSSFGDDVLVDLSENRKPSHTKNTGSTKEVYDKFWKYNPFINGDNRITSIQDLDGIEDLTGYNMPTLYSRESKPQWLERNFVYMFLAGLRSTGTQYISYDQQLHTISDKPNPIGAQVRVISEDKIKDSIKAIVVQHDEKQKIDKNAHTPSEKRTRNADGFLVGKYNPKHAIMFSDILNNGKSVSNRANAIMKQLVEHSKEVQSYIENNSVRLPDNLASLRNKLVDKNILNKPSEGLEDSQILSDLVRTFVTNYAVNGFFANQLVIGDQGAFKSEYDLIKRMSIVFAPGTAGTVNQNFGMKEKFTVAVMEDPVGSAFDYLTKREYNKLQNDLRNIYGEDFDLADAQGYMRPERAADIMRGFPGLNLGLVMKGVYARVGDDGQLRTLKYSSIALTEELTRKHPKLKKVLNAMEEKGVDEVVFTSGVKNGQPLTLSKHGYKTSVNVHGKETTMPTANKNFNPEIHDNSIMELYNDSFRIQLDPVSDINSLVANMSQLTYLINTNGQNRAEAAEYYKITSEIMDMGLMNFMNELGLVNNSGQLKSYRDIKNKEGVRRQIRIKVLAALRNLESGQKEAEMLSAKVRRQKGNTLTNTDAVSLNFPGLVNKVISNISSQFSKSTVSFRLPGSKLVLQSSYGVTIYQTTAKGIMTYDQIEAEAKREGMSVSNYKRRIGARERDLQHMTGKTPYVEVIMPAIYRGRVNLGDDVYQKTGKGNILGFRIPSTELHSAVALRIVGFYDSSETNVIIAPKEIVPLHGSDFDVDSLFIVRKAIMEDKDKSGKYLYATDKRGLVDPTDDTNVLIPVGTDLNYNQADTLHDIFTRTQNETDRKDPAYKAISRLLSKLDAIKLAAKKNDLLDLYLNVIQADKNRYSMLTPISLGLIKNETNSVFAELAKRLGVKVEDLLPKKNLMLPLEEAHMHQSNKDGAQLVGRFANLMKAVAYMFNSGEQIMLQGPQGTTKSLNLTPKLQDSKGNDINVTINDVDYGMFHRNEISRNKKGELVKSDYTIWQTFDMFINAAIDNAKEQILHILNVTNNTGGELAVMTALGIPLEVSTKILMQPSLQIVGQSSGSQVQALKLATSTIKTLLINEHGLSEADYLKLSTNDVKITTFKLNKAFNKNTHKIKELEELSKSELLFQLEILRLFRTLGTPAKNLATISRELNVLRKLPTTFHEIEESKETWEQITGNTEEGKDYISSKGKGIQFNIPELLNRNPHVRSAIKALGQLHKLVGSVIPKHSKQIVDFSNSIVKGMQIQQGETAHSTSEYLRGELTKYLAASYYNTDSQKPIKITSYGNKEIMIGGIDAFNESLIKQIEEHEDKSTNGFLNQLTVVKRRSGLKFMKFSNATGLPTEELHGIYEQFEKLSPQLQQDIVKYATLNEGLSFGAANITMVLNPIHVSEVDFNLNTLMRSMAYTDKGVEKLENLKEDFLIQFAFNNYEMLPKHYSVDSAAYKEGNKNSIVDYGGITDDNIIYDLKVDLQLRANPPLLMADHNRAKVYIRVHAEQLDLGGGFAYYQEVGRAQDSFTTTKYSSDLTVGSTMYDNRKYFVKDVLTRAKEDLYNEEGEIAQEVIYTPRNDKKLRGVEEGGNMILRPYDDYTRKRALMYEVVAVVDNWGSQNAKNLKD